MRRDEIRRAAVAGSFYPRDAGELGTLVSSFLEGPSPEGPPPRALIAPHAGYPYSGPVAGSAFRTLTGSRRRAWRRVVVLGPSHYVPFRGLATSGAEAFETPLGTVRIDVRAEERLLQLPQVTAYPLAHQREHCLEVELPFLQVVLGDFALVALVVGQASAAEVEEVLTALADPDTIVVVSSDLSHYHEYRVAQRIDAATCRAIETLSRDDLGPEEACGAGAVNGLIRAARHRRWRVETLDLRSSGDTAGPHDRVVGYGAWRFLDP